MEDMNNCLNTPSTVINKINCRRQSAIKIINSKNFNKKKIQIIVTRLLILSKEKWQKLQ